MSENVNFQQLMALRRKIKKFDITGIQRSSKMLKTVKDKNLSTKVLQATEFPRTLKWIINKTNGTEDKDKEKLGVLCRFLFKKWKKQLTEDLLDEGVTKKPIQQNNGTQHKQGRQA